MQIIIQNKNKCNKIIQNFNKITKIQINKVI